MHDAVEFNIKAVEKKWKTELVSNLVSLSDSLFGVEQFTNTNIENCFHEYLQSSGIGFGKLMPMLRIAITGNLAGPSMFDSLELLGKEKMKQRVDAAIQILN